MCIMSSSFIQHVNMISDTVESYLIHVNTFLIKLTDILLAVDYYNILHI